MGFNGFGNIDLSGIKDDRPTMLDVGRHAVTIKEAKVDADTSKKTHQLVLTYESDSGSIRQWIYLNHPNSPKATEIGLSQVKSLLKCLGHDGDSTPEDVNYFVGKKVGINVKNEEYNGEIKKKVNYHWKIEDVKTSNDLDDEIPWD